MDRNPESKKLIVIGAGGHGKVVVDTCLAAGWSVIGTADSDPRGTVFDLPHLGRPEDLRPMAGVHAVVAIGSNAMRRDLARRLEGRFPWATVVHPTAVVSPRARLDEGAVVFAGAIVQADATVERHAVLNTGCRVDHDNRIGAFSHVAPGAVLAGTVMAGEGSLVGAGAVVIQNCTLGAWSTVGAGAVMLDHAEPGQTYVGVPAKSIKARFITGEAS